MGGNFGVVSIYTIHVCVYDALCLRFGRDLWKAAQRRLDALHSAHSLDDLSLPGFRLKPMKYTMRGFYSMRINDQFRIVFRYQDGDAYDVEITDYHD